MLLILLSPKKFQSFRCSLFQTEWRPNIHISYYKSKYLSYYKSNGYWILSKAFPAFIDMIIPAYCNFFPVCDSFFMSLWSFVLWELAFFSDQICSLFCYLTWPSTKKGFPFSRVTNTLLCIFLLVLLWFLFY